MLYTLDCNKMSKIDSFIQSKKIVVNVLPYLFGTVTLVVSLVFHVHLLTSTTLHVTFYITLIICDASTHRTVIRKCDCWLSAGHRHRQTARRHRRALGTVAGRWGRPHGAAAALLIQDTTLAEPPHPPPTATHPALCASFLFRIVCTFPLLISEISFKGL